MIKLYEIFKYTLDKSISNPGIPPVIKPDWLRASWANSTPKDGIGAKLGSLS